TSAVNRQTWSHLGDAYHAPGQDDQYDYLQWYYLHVPRAAGVNLDGKQNNWWKYIYDFNNYTSDGKPLPVQAKLSANDLYNLGGKDQTFSVIYSGATPLSTGSMDSSDVYVTGPN